MKGFPASFFLLFFVGFATFSWVLALPHDVLPKDSGKFILGQENLVPWKNEILETAEGPGSAKNNSQSPLVLAANRTKRPDILHGFRVYEGGWDIANQNYWASVGFTGATGFILSIFWFISFGCALLVHRCCGWKLNLKGEESKTSHWICLALLVVFTSAATIGCILLCIGQNNFYNEGLHTLKYVVNQSDYTVDTLRNVTEYLSLAKTINVAQVFLPSDVMNEIDELNVGLNTAADTVADKTSLNSRKIRKVFTVMRSALITVAAIMLLLALIGLFLSFFGYQHAIYILIISGWLLVTITFVLCGLFVILDNAVSDTCMAMEEWVENTHAETALSNILPCVDHKTTNQTLIQSKKIVNDIVNVVDQFVYNFANANPSPDSPNYRNQSGPPMPALCYPYNSQLEESRCGDNDVTIDNASTVWQKFVCQVSESGTCVTVGRVSPDIHSQMVAAVNESYALQHYTPPLLSFQNCNFVRETFHNITTAYCPHLHHHLKIVNVGLAMISVGILLCLLLWILYANHSQREAVSVKLSFSLNRRRNSNQNTNNNSNGSGNDESTTSSIRSIRSGV
ncbi:uncharacterized protein LOC101211567 [Cucumis sativus]|uniref:Uncharacterized protein n=1 Tax=Cucumis sativus TaxID=3659 RepID=A0A0A0KRA9_CUCSA|nr:uncharacterized protein LOC101211567 [Cucumis sativus]KGN52138.1 hypothetical protein Csa_009105 [Cucumis sativus]